MEELQNFRSKMSEEEEEEEESKRRRRRRRRSIRIRKLIIR